MKKKMPLAHARFALSLGVGHWAFAAATQLQHPAIGGAVAAAQADALHGYLLLQLQNLAIAGSLAGLAYLLAISLAGRWFSIAIASLVNLGLVADHIYYRLSFQHFRFSAVEGAQTFQEALWSSLRYELDTMFLVHVASAAVLMVWWLRQASRVEARDLTPIPTLARLLVLLSLGFISLGTHKLATVEADEHSIHPLFALFDDLDPLRRDTHPSNGYLSVATLPVEPPLLDERFSQLQARLNGLTAPRNVILVILESVGARQLLTEQNQPSLALTPNLHSLAQHAVTFDALYSVFPGTVRSHVAINTGGVTLTWGNVFHEFSFPYIGPTLAGTLRAQGYETALFASQRLDFENMEGFYTQAGYDTVFDFGREPTEIQNSQALSSWGAREEYTLAKLEAWLTQQRDRSKPFLITYLTVATHHPYDFPGDLPNLEAGDERQTRYRNALRYTDRAIGALTELLQREGLADDTILAITGDHGQAFGDVHEGNLVHKHFLYEENIRNFLLLHNRKVFPVPIESERIGSIGDIMPTLLDAAGAASAPIPGTSLLAPARVEQPAFFYKNAHPAQWGLRYRDWKYIAAMDGESPELYDLSTDPNEQRNLASGFLKQISVYQRLAEQWYFRTNDAFVANLQDYTPPGGHTLRPSDIATPGPKLLAVGHGQLTGGYRGVEFHAASALHTAENPIAWTQWLPYSEPQKIIFQWHAPAGAVYRHNVTVEPGWLLSYIGYEGPIPLEEGTWRLELVDARDGNILLDTAFTVDKYSPLHLRADARPQALEASIGLRHKGDHGEQGVFEAADVLASGDAPVMWTRWAPAPRTKRIWVSWESPRSIEAEGYFDIQQAWNQTWINFEGKRPLTPGAWSVTLWDEAQDVLLIEAGFEVRD